MHRLSSPFIVRLLVAVAGVGMLVTVARFIPLDGASLRYYAERMEFRIHPSAARAYAFGMHHFSASTPADYNMDRAIYFFRKAIALDPQYPLAHQQLARLEFIEGNFGTATTLINTELALQGDKDPSGFYVRALIEGYQANYEAAARDYAHFIELNPTLWAGYNDYAWVLMKTGRYDEARAVLVRGLAQSPKNAWLLNSYAIALYETGDAAEAAVVASRAVKAVQQLTPLDWSNADPGNDPAIAAEGLRTFQEASVANLQKIEAAAATAH